MIGAFRNDIPVERTIAPFRAEPTDYDASTTPSAYQERPLAWLPLRRPHPARIIGFVVRDGMLYRRRFSPLLASQLQSCPARV